MNSFYLHSFISLSPSLSPSFSPSLLLTHTQGGYNDANTAKLWTHLTCILASFPPPPLLFSPLLSSELSLSFHTDTQTHRHTCIHTHTHTYTHTHIHTYTFTYLSVKLFFTLLYSLTHTHIYTSDYEMEVAEGVIRNENTEESLTQIIEYGDTHTHIHTHLKYTLSLLTSLSSELSKKT